MAAIDRYKKTVQPPQTDTATETGRTAPLPRSPFYKRLLKWFGKVSLKFVLMIFVLLLILAIYQAVMG